MKKPVISRAHAVPGNEVRSNERGITMALVAVAMVAIVAMAALSIDVVTLYLDREEAQRSADEAALAAARVLAVSGITGDPSNKSGDWGQVCGPGGTATLAAQAVVGQNTVANSVPGTINVSYSAGTGSVGSITSNADCQTLTSTAFGSNPLVTVKVTRAGLPTFFSRIWGNTSNSVSATATAEAYNPSGTVGNETSGTITPVQPTCVKPWVVPNRDPLNPAPKPFCTATGCATLVSATDGSITNPGISLQGTGATGVIGETFTLVSDCQKNGGNCTLRRDKGVTVPPQANFSNGTGNIPQPPNLLYVPGLVAGTPTAVPTCSGAEAYEQAITGCDQPTNYQCGVQNANVVDLGINPNQATANGVQCLTNQSNSGDVTAPTGQDYLQYDTTFGDPSVYPFQILAGSGNPMTGAGLAAGTPITGSASIVSLPIYDDQQAGLTINSGAQTNVTFVGFLQVFIDAVDGKGNVMVTVLNVSGCSNGLGGNVGTPIPGTSPVPVRLITPP